MSIDLYQIGESANLFAKIMIEERPLDEKEVLERSQSIIMNSQFERDIVTNIVIGAIRSYHQQLRELLLEKDIDIGEII